MSTSLGTVPQPSSAIRAVGRLECDDDQRRVSLLGESLLTAEEVGSYLGVHKSTVYRMAGKVWGIECVRVGGAIRFKPAAVRAFVERSTVCKAPSSRADRLLGAVAEGGPGPRPQGM